MDTTAWTVIAVGVTILIAIGTSFRSLRSEIREVRKDGEKLRDQIGQLRERMAKLEGLLEGLREAITAKRAA